MAGLLLRGEDNRVGFAELFFDLVFVFAITQVSHLLLYKYSALGAIQSGLLLLAIWWVWVFTTWVLNRLDPDKGAVRGMLFAMMVAGLFLSMAVPEAFGDRGLVFAIAFVAMQVGRTVFMFFASGTDPVLRRTFFRIGVWLALSGAFWVLGGVLSPEMRLRVWALAILVEYIGPLVGFYVPGIGRDPTTNWSVRGGHLAERFGLFVIICLGETLLVSGATYAEMDWTTPGTAAFLSSIAGTIGMWWVYFHIGHRRGAHQIETSDDPGRLARLAYTYAHLPIVAGIILAAVGSERAIAHPGDPGRLAESASILGGTALFLVGNGLFKRISAQRFPLTHVVGIALCAGLAVIGPLGSLLQVNAGAALILALVAVWERISLGDTMSVQGH